MEHTESVHQKKSTNKSDTEKNKLQPGTTGMKKYPGFCDICAKSSKHIEWHMYYNHNTDPIECSYCKKMFSNREILKKHEKNHLLEPCSICGKMVKKPKMFYHMKQNHTSNEDKPYKCEVCGKGFITKFSRNEHINIHTGAKPFKCKYCPAAFGSNGTKAMHERGHLGIKRKPKKS